MEAKSESEKRTKVPLLRTTEAMSEKIFAGFFMALNDSRLLETLEQFFDKSRIPV